MTPTTEELRAELLPCPFCGSTDLRGPSAEYIERAAGYGYTLYKIDHHVHIGMSCTASVFAGTPEQAIAAWNRRSPPPAAEGGWISVEERLPEEYTPVLITGIARTGNCFGVHMGERRSGEWRFHEGDMKGGCDPCLDEVVTHWMPLPSPPAITKAGKKGE